MLVFDVLRNECVEWLQYKSTFNFYLKKATIKLICDTYLFFLKATFIDMNDCDWLDALGISNYCFNYSIIFSQLTKFDPTGKNLIYIYYSIKREKAT